MDVYLKNEKEKNTFHFPVNPFQITVDRKKNYNTSEIIDFGEIDINDKGKKIKEISISTVLPKEYDSYCKYFNVPNPIEVVAMLEKWSEQIEPLRLIITDFDFNELVNLVSISEEEKASESGDKYIILNFRVWRELKIITVPPPKVVITVPTVPLVENRPVVVSSPRTYTVVRGDSLWKIAKKFYGDGAKWPTIYNNAQNKATIGRNPNLIYPGQRLVIP